MPRNVHAPCYLDCDINTEFVFPLVCFLEVIVNCATFNLGLFNEEVARATSVGVSSMAETPLGSY